MSADAVMTLAELRDWRAKYSDTPFNMLAFATSAAQDAGPMEVMRSLFYHALVLFDDIAHDVLVLLDQHVSDEVMSEARHRLIERLASA